MKKPLWIVLGLCVVAAGAFGIWKWRKSVAARRGPALRDGRGRPRTDRREGDRDRHAVGAGDGPGRHPGLGPHQGDQRRLQLAGEEGPGDRADRAAAVRGRARVRRAPTTWRRRATVAKLEAQADNAKLQHERAAGAVRAQGDRAGRPRHRAGDADAPPTATLVAARGNLAQAKAALHQAAGEPRLHDHRVADRRRRHLAQRRRRPDRGGVAAGADAVPDRRGPDARCRSTPASPRPTSAS